MFLLRHLALYHRIPRSSCAYRSAKSPLRFAYAPSASEFAVHTLSPATASSPIASTRTQPLRGHPSSLPQPRPPPPLRTFASRASPPRSACLLDTHGHRHRQAVTLAQHVSPSSPFHRIPSDRHHSPLLDQRDCSQYSQLEAPRPVLRDRLTTAQCDDPEPYGRGVGGAVQVEVGWVGSVEGAARDAVEGAERRSREALGRRIGGTFRSLALRVPNVSSPLLLDPAKETSNCLEPGSFASGAE